MNNITIDVSGTHIHITAKAMLVVTIDQEVFMFDRKADKFIPPIPARHLAEKAYDVIQTYFTYSPRRHKINQIEIEDMDTGQEQ